MIDPAKQEELLKRARALDINSPLKPRYPRNTNSKLPSWLSSPYSKIFLTFILLIILFSTTFFVSSLALQKKQENDLPGQDIIPESEIKLPTAEILDNTANWETFKNEDLNYEFKHPPNWIEPSCEEGSSSCLSTFGYIIGQSDSKDPRIDKNLNKTYWISVDYISQDQLNKMGITYCAANPDDSTRCESTKTQDSSTVIAWGPSPQDQKDYLEISATAWISHPRGGVVTLSLQPVASEAKPVFRQILSTFEFIDSEVQGVTTISCLETESELLEEINECESVNEERCLELKEEFENCIYSCQKDLEKEMCLDICKPVCSNSELLDS